MRTRVEATYHVRMTDPVSSTYEPTEAWALAADEADPLRRFRERFHFPDAEGGAGEPIYFTGNSLGLMPKAARAFLEEELEDWARLGVDGHRHSRRPWYSYHELFRESLARLVGARPGEVVAMNSLTVNIHLLMISFYRPSGKRRRILIEDAAFPSDSYAVQSQLRLHGLDPSEALIRLRPRTGEHTLRTEDIVRTIEENADTLALVHLPGVNYLTGQFFEMETITRAAREAGVAIGWDLAHAAGNVPMRLHEWGPDFATWCTYKYCNGGPGSVGGAFVHERHAASPHLPRLAGWWGNDPETRFRMDPDFRPREGAEGWQVSNPPIFSMTSLRAALDIFDEAGMDALRQKSIRLTGYLEFLLDGVSRDFGTSGSAFEIITPREPGQRGCQLSIAVHLDEPRGLFDRLRGAGVVCDWREPNVIRLAPAPLYNSFHDVWRFGRRLAEGLSG